MSNPFDTTHASVGPIPTASVTLPQRKALRAMGLEKAELVGVDPQKAEAMIEDWLRYMPKETATTAIRKLGRWLDDERARRGLVRNR